MYKKGQYIIYGIRGVCEVTDIITMEHPGQKERRLYYELHPCHFGEGRIVSPVDSQKTVTRALLTKEEAMALISEIPLIPQMQLVNDKLREEQYKQALKSCDCRVWVSMIKALYFNRQQRLLQGKRMTDLDERYYKAAEETLYGELSVALEISKSEAAACIKKQLEA